MRKRGQIYILAAIMLGIIIYSISIVVNVADQEEIKGDFETLSKNFETESSKLINSVIQSGGDVPASFANFTVLFTSYSKAKSPNFNIFYALAYENKLYVGNFMNNDIYLYKPCPNADECYASDIVSGCLDNVSAQISFEGLTLDSNFIKGDFDITTSECIKTLNLSGSEQDFCVEIEGTVYNLSVDPNTPRIYSLSRLRSGNQILNSIQGEVGQEQVCEGRSEEGCCHDFCCWNDGSCIEGKCSEGEQPSGGAQCKDGTPIDECSTSEEYGPPWYCDSNKKLKRNCKPIVEGGCGCPLDGETYWCYKRYGRCIKTS